MIKTISGEWMRIKSKQSQISQRLYVYFHVVLVSAAYSVVGRNHCYEYVQYFSVIVLI